MVADRASDSARKRIDSLENRAISLVRQKNDEGIDSMTVLAALAMEDSRRIGYSHGMAVALACQAVYLDMHTSDFPRAEQLGRESLYWFDRTDDKYGITMAYYVLGFSLFCAEPF